MERGEVGKGGGAREKVAHLFMCVCCRPAGSAKRTARGSCENHDWELFPQSSAACVRGSRTMRKEQPPPPTSYRALFLRQIARVKGRKKKIQKLRSGFLSIWLATPFLLLLFFFKELQLLIMGFYFILFFLRVDFFLSRSVFMF